MLLSLRRSFGRSSYWQLLDQDGAPFGKLVLLGPEDIPFGFLLPFLALQLLELAELDDQVLAILELDFEICSRAVQQK